jgi:hypothetical protein
VSDEELKHALASLAMSRGTAPSTAVKKAPDVQIAAIQGSVADRFAAFRAKSQKTDAAGSPQVAPTEEKKPS